MASHDVTEGHLGQDDGRHGGPTEGERLARALRWVIGRSPQTDPEADRRLLRSVAARLVPDGEPTPAALDAHLSAVLAEMATTGELADHAEPRHRPWITTVGRIYFCDPTDLPEDLREEIGSETVLRHLGDGVSNRARAAARVLGVADNAVRVRREPALLRAAAAALLDRADRIERAADRPAPDRGPSVPVPAAPAPAGGGPDPRTGEHVSSTGGGPSPARPAWRSGRAAAAGIGTLVVALALVAAVVVASSRDAREDHAGQGGRARATAVGPIPVVPDDVVVLGVRDGDLVALADGAAVDLGLDGVVAADAQREGATVHVVALRADGRLLYGAVGGEPGSWIDLGGGRREAEVGVDRAGQPVVVALESDAGDLTRRTIDADGRPAGGWQRLAATDAVDIDLATNRDGRLEVGGVSASGSAFNIWQTGAPGGWSNYSDTRAGEDGRRIQAVANLDGRLELFVERADRSLWNTWQEAPGRSWRTGWDPRYLEDLRRWRVAVGAEGHLVVVALTDHGVLLRRQVRVPQPDGTTKLMWAPSTEVEELDPLGGPVPGDVTLVATEDAATVVATGDGRTVALAVGPEGPGVPRPLAATAVDALVPVDG